MATHPEPLISCLCLSRNRPEQLARAIECFLAQTWVNKELIVVYPESDLSTASCVSSYRSEQIRPQAITLPGATLGELRNFSIECARGEYLCGWDDDDWHSPDRLRRQYLSLWSSKKCASVLARTFIYEAAARRAYLSCERLWENSVFFHKAEIERLGIRYPHLKTKEDYEFVNALVKHNLVYPVYDPTSYVYNVSGTNTCDSAHFSVMLKRATPLNEQQTAVVRRAMEMSLPPLDAYEQLETKEIKSPIMYVRHSPLPRY